MTQDKKQDRKQVTRHYLVGGMVQGVGFRNFVYQAALSLGVLGWVRNLEDGRVEILALADEGELKQFEENLRSGSRRSRVDTFEVRVVPTQISWDTFSVNVDGRKPWSYES